MHAARLALLLLLFAVPVVASAEDRLRLGRVAALQGELAVADGQDWRSVGAGTRIGVGDRLTTVGPSRALIQLDGGLTLTLGARTEMTIGEAAPDDGAFGFVLDLAKGIVRAVLRPSSAGTAATVRSALAVTSVRSTEWTVEHGDAGTAVFVRSGTANVTAEGATVVLGPGDGTDVTPGNAPSPVHAWGERRVADTLARSTLGR